MFNITHQPKPGVCKARRCKHSIISDGLCEKHFAEWSAAGKPTFSEQGAAIVAANLASSGLKEALAEELVGANNSLELIKSTPIVDQRSMDIAGAWLGGVRDAVADLNRRKCEQLKPIKESQKALADTFKPVEKVYAECEAILRDRMNGHMRMQQQLQDRARLEVQAAGGAVDHDTLVVAHGIENVALPVGVGMREVWTYEIQDEAALRRAVALSELELAATDILEICDPAIRPEVDAKVQGILADVQWLVGALAKGASVLAPVLALTVDHKALATLARELKGDAEIAGVRVYQQASITAPRRTGGGEGK